MVRCDGGRDAIDLAMGCICGVLRDGLMNYESSGWGRVHHDRWSSKVSCDEMHKQVQGKAS